MKEKIIMFTTYIEFFHKLHTKYLKRFSQKIQLMYSHINHDIHFDDIKKTNSGDSSDNNSKNSEEKNDLKSSSSDSDYESNTSANSFDINENNVRSRTNSSTSSGNLQPVSPKFKLQNIIKQTENDSLKSYNELNDIFSTIDITCESILNKNTKNELLSNHSSEQLLDVKKVDDYLIEPPE